MTEVTWVTKMTMETSVTWVTWVTTVTRVTRVTWVTWVTRVTRLTRVTRVARVPFNYICISLNLSVYYCICIGCSMISSDIWHKYHEWYFRQVSSFVWFVFDFWVLRFPHLGASCFGLRFRNYTKVWHCFNETGVTAWLRDCVTSNVTVFFSVDLQSLFH